MSSGRVAFERVRSQRAHEEVAEQIRRQIVLRVVAPAGALPPERELARLFGVGRATVQRAIGLLEEEGLVERRRGRTGGTFVVGAAGSAGSADRLIETLRATRAAVEEALAYRLEVEPAAAEAAALARTDADLARLAVAASAAAAAQDDAEFMESDTDFHLILAATTGNRFFADAIERTRLALNDALVALPDSPVWHAWSNRDHRAILHAVEAADGRRARTAMSRHVRHTDASVRALLATVDP
ncbi:MAG: GntR family transcriptional regulator, transcriptional repressor for pyruvate dehydrogenase complex [Gaiellaceae bacterium]|nr:GntR family transcriptional regulator, transcriptional repressor for pyruvate dehydrogenase complex [Gaiellaceae bacterium]